MVTVMLLGPSLSALSGVSTHLNQLLQSSLAEEFNLLHFQVGSEGRMETVAQKLVRFVLSPVQFFWKMLQNNPKIIHLNTSLETKSYWRDNAYLLLARMMGKKIVYQVHGGALPQVFFKNNIILTKFLGFVLKSTDVVVLLAQEELQAYRRFNPKLRLEVIPNAIEVGDDANWKRIPPAKGKPLQLAYIGRLARNKGIFEIIEAVAIVRGHGRDIKLLIAGTGPDEIELRAQVKTLDCDYCVNFVGPLYGKAKTKAWEEADLFVFPTYHREGLPYALLESMATRTPPLVSPVGAIPDVMDDGVHGIFVPSQNPQALAAAIEQLDDDREFICRMGEACRQRIVDHYTIDKLAENFRQLYLDLVK
jgi:glycosyltransferase involved in cell wall biosynthesis